MTDCDLCEAAQITTRYLDDETCWIADCEVCDVPMVVWRVHDTDPPPEVRARLHALLSAVADTKFGEGHWSFDDQLRSVKDHYHAHARKRSFFLPG